MSDQALANLFAGLPEALPEELFTVLAEGEGARVERIVSPPGHATAAAEWYDQDRDEWVVVLRGRARLEIAGQAELLEMGPGDHLRLPARLRHRVAWTSPDEPTVWLAVHYR